MPQIELNAFKLLKYSKTCVTTSLEFGGNAPRKTVEIRTVADCIKAIEVFKGELVKTGKPWTVSTFFIKKSGRKPAGFDAAQRAGKLRAYVNEHLVEEKVEASS